MLRLKPSLLRILYQVIRKINRQFYTLQVHTHTQFKFIMLVHYKNEFSAVFTAHIIGFHAHSFYLRRLLSKLRNLLTQSNFKHAGPVLTHNLHRH